MRAGENACKEQTSPWRGMRQLPGYVLLPMEYLERDEGGASPWWECTLTLRDENV